MYLVVILVIMIVVILYNNNQQLILLQRENRATLKTVKSLQSKNHQLQMRPTTIIKKITKKPKKVIPQYERRFRYIRLYSGDRDTGKYPNAAQFEIKLPSSIRNIESVELNKFSMTKSMYAVDDHNSIMIVRDISVDVKYIIKIVHGFYSIGAYRDAVNKQFIENEMDLRLEFDNITHTVTVSNIGVDTIYEILYSTEEFEDSNFNLIGFAAEDFILNPLESKTGSRRVDMFGATNISLQLKEVSYGYGDDILGTVLVKENIITAYENDNERPRRVISPLLKLDRITLRTTFQPAYKERRLYEFNGIEYSVVLEVVTLEKKMPFQQLPSY